MLKHIYLRITRACHRVTFHVNYVSHISKYFQKLLLYYARPYCRKHSIQDSVHFLIFEVIYYRTSESCLQARRCLEIWKRKTMSNGQFKTSRHVIHIKLRIWRKECPIATELRSLSVTNSCASRFLLALFCHWLACQMDKKDEPNTNPLERDMLCWVQGVHKGPPEVQHK